MQSARLALARSFDLLAAVRVILTDGVKPIKMKESTFDLERFYASLEKMYGVSISLDSESVGLFVDCDMSAMTRVIENIVENCANAGATKISIVNKVVDGFSVSRYIDNGRGCPSPELIGSGYTTTTTGEGHGQGSCMSQKEMVRMGGSIRWESNAQGGLDTITSLRILTPLPVAA